MCGRQTSSARLLLCAVLPRITFKFSLVHRRSHWQAHNQRLHLWLLTIGNNTALFIDCNPHLWVASYLLRRLLLWWRQHLSSRECMKPFGTAKFATLNILPHAGQSQQWSHGGFEAAHYFKFDIGQGVVLQVSSSISTRVRRNVKW